MENKTAFNQEQNSNLIITSLIAFLGMALLIAIAWFLKIPNPNMVLITGLIIFTRSADYFVLHVFLFYEPQLFQLHCR